MKVIYDSKKQEYFFIENNKVFDPNDYCLTLGTVLNVILNEGNRLCMDNDDDKLTFLELLTKS